jgi:hypothetical protein
MLRWLDELPWLYLIIACLTLGLAPFVPEPHIVEKLRMLSQGTLERPIDIFDLLLHALPFMLAAIKAWRAARGSEHDGIEGDTNHHSHNDSDSGGSSD